MNRELRRGDLVSLKGLVVSNSSSGILVMVDQRPLPGVAPGHGMFVTDELTLLTPNLEVGDRMVLKGVGNCVVVTAGLQGGTALVQLQELGLQGSESYRIVTVDDLEFDNSATDPGALLSNIFTQAPVAPAASSIDVMQATVAQVVEARGAVGEGGSVAQQLN